MVVVKAYPYLFATISGLCIVALLSFLFLPRKRRLLLFLNGLLGIPSFPLIAYFEDLYWYPKRIGSLNIGVEDALVSYLVATLAWGIFTIPLNPNLCIDFKMKTFLKRYLLIVIPAAQVFWVGCKLGLNPMTVLLLITIGLVIIILSLRQDLMPCVIWCLIGFPVTYVLFFNLVFLIWPDFITQWNLSTYWGHVVIGLPLGEFVWAFGHGVFWPLFSCYVFNITYTSQNISFPLVYRKRF
jgi:hypothetical protein